MKKKTMHYFMQQAIEEAKKAYAMGEVPIGAVVVQKDVVIARAHNLKESTGSPTAHAEILAIEAASQRLGRWRLSDCSLYVTAEPCPMCVGAIMQAQIPKLVYGVNEARYGAIESSVFLKNHPMLPKGMEIYGGICEKDCGELLTRFFKQHRFNR
ncbi:MAG: nucleoside deaminase [Eubacteriaceae bacterium]|jgi:tRNA(adenine34) deaminase|nr:nucleoside deaminase [Eubacteriaceae bacterium]